MYTAERDYIVCSFGQTVCENVAGKFPGETIVTLCIMANNSQDYFHTPTCAIYLE